MDPARGRRRAAGVLSSSFKAVASAMLNPVSEHALLGGRPAAAGHRHHQSATAPSSPTTPSISISTANEIHALLGENGAGKSTLVKVIYGLIQPTAGELRWMGEKIELAGPSEARALGIGMVFQHFSLFDNLTVAENVALGLDGSESFAAMSARLAQVSRDYGLPLDPKREVWRLSVGERQRIEIVRAADAESEAA